MRLNVLALADVRRKSVRAPISGISIIARERDR